MAKRERFQTKRQAGGKVSGLTYSDRVKHGQYAVYGATQAMLAAAEYRPSPKRMTLTEVTRQMASLKANIDRIDMRMDKADKPGNGERYLHFARLHKRSVEQYQALVAEFIRLGGGTIKG